MRPDEVVVPSRNFRGEFWAATAAGYVVQQGCKVENMRERTHIPIADDIPSLGICELMACSGETLDKLLLQTKRVSRELELPRQGMETYRCDRQSKLRLFRHWTTLT
jgi:hypothetical protein